MFCVLSLNGVDRGTPLCRTCRFVGNPGTVKSERRNKLSLPSDTGRPEFHGILSTATNHGYQGTSFSKFRVEREGINSYTI